MSESNSSDECQTPVPRNTQYWSSPNLVLFFGVNINQPENVVLFVCDLRHIFTERYGSSVEPFVNCEVLKCFYFSYFCADLHCLDHMD